MNSFPDALPPFAEDSKSKELYKQANQQGLTMDQFMSRDGEDVGQQISITMSALLVDCRNPDGTYDEMKFRGFWKMRRNDINENRDGWRLGSLIAISDYHNREIARLWKDANEFFPTKPDLAAKYAWDKAKRRGSRFWDAWKWHHMQFDSLDRPVHEDPSLETVADTVPSPHPWGEFNQMSIDMDWAFEEHGLTAEHRLIANYLTENPKMTVREIAKRLKDDDGIKISATTVHNRKKDLKAALTTFMERKRESD
jgi:hypothetical protein